MTMVVVTHEVAFAQEVADTIVFMDGGSIIAHGSPDEVLRGSEDERLRSFLATYREGAP